MNTPPRCLAILAFASVLFSTGLLAVPSGAQAQTVLSLSPSAQQNGMGGAGVALPTTDAAGFFYNPAHLGHLGRAANLAVQAYPDATTWLPGFGRDLRLSNTAVSAGYDLSGRLRVPLSVGAGFQRTAFDIGPWQRSPLEAGPAGAAFEQSERARALAVGAGLDYFVDVSAGVAIKHTRLEDRTPPPSGGTVPLRETAPASDVETSVSAWVVDVGVLATLPVVEAARRILGAAPGGRRRVAPFADLTLGYSAQNFGGAVNVSDDYAPLLRTRAGAGLRTGADLAYAGGALRLLDLQGTVETDEGTFRHGWRMEVGQTFSVSRGGFDGGGYEDRQTHGLGLRAAGLFKLLGAVSGNALVQALADHADVQYTRATYFAGSDFASDFQSFALVVRGL